MHDQKQSFLKSEADQFYDRMSNISVDYSTIQLLKYWVA